MARRKNPTPNYATQYEDEGRRWIESQVAPCLYDAELEAKNQARSRNIRVLATLPLIHPES